jgi:hypothetical protein
MRMIVEGEEPIPLTIEVACHMMPVIEAEVERLCEVQPGWRDRPRAEVLSTAVNSLIIGYRGLRAELAAGLTIRLAEELSSGGFNDSEE